MGEDDQCRRVEKSAKSYGEKEKKREGEGEPLKRQEGQHPSGIDEIAEGGRGREKYNRDEKRKNVPPSEHGKKGGIQNLARAALGYVRIRDEKGECA